MWRFLLDFYCLAAFAIHEPIETEPIDENKKYGTAQIVCTEDGPVIKVCGLEGIKGFSAQEMSILNSRIRQELIKGN